MAALLPTLVSAIMGSNRNKGFDPKNPDSKPYDERTTGMGRFLQRFGSGVDTGELNNEYAAKRYADERNFEQQSTLQKAGQDFQSQLADKEDNSRWKFLKSRLDNDAAMETSRQGFQSRLLGERNNEDARRERLREAQRNYEETGTWDPMEQQAIKKKLIDQKLNDPIRLGAGAYIDRGSGMTHYVDPGSGPGFDPTSGDLTPSTPRGWRTYDPNNPAPSTGTSAPPGAGRPLGGDPEELRNALGIKPKANPAAMQMGSPTEMIQPAPTNTPSFLDKARNGISNQLGAIGGRIPSDTNGPSQSLPEIVSKFLKRLGIDEGQLQQGMQGNLAKMR